MSTLKLKSPKMVNSERVFKEGEKEKSLKNKSSSKESLKSSQTQVKLLSENFHSNLTELS